MDAGSIAAAVSGLQTAADLAKGLLDLKISTEIQAKIGDLQHQILAAQISALTANAEQFAMLQRIRELEEEVARVKAWEETKQRYELHEPMQGTFVYALKPVGGDPEPAHWICTTCYEQGKRSILQLQSPEARPLDKDIKADQEYIFAQLGIVTDIRNDILHYGATFVC